MKCCECQDWDLSVECEMLSLPIVSQLLLGFITGHCSSLRSDFQTPYAGKYGESVDCGTLFP
jgi:hypothetical protein